ncbi:hypothetical protein ABPG72_005364 [Tetrahymena utriculariae]
MQFQKKETFKSKFSLEERQQQFQNTIVKYPEMIPCIIQAYQKAQLLKPLQKPKFMVSKNIKLFELQRLVISKLNIEKEINSGIYTIYWVISDNRIEKISKLIYEIYQQSKDKQDGFLYLYYSDVDPFG